MESFQEFADISGQEAVRGFLHMPSAPDGSALVLTHSAGGNCQAPLLVAVAEAFAAAGTTVLR
ncbi:MAG: alpha/beta hydrolase, partial [Acidobacteriaceae bacterium]